MNVPSPARWLPWLWLLAALPLPLSAADDDDDPAGPGLTLTAAQQAAIGIEVATPVAATPTPRLAAIGRVLDAALPITDFAALDADRATARAGRQERDRLRGLHADGAAAALRRVEAADAEAAQAQAALDAASARLAAQWGPLAAMADGDRQALLQRLRSGQAALLRVDLPGRQSLPDLPGRAEVSIDGIAFAANVLGPLRAGSAAPAALLELPAAPAGLAAGVRLAVALEGEAVAGFIVPGTALLHDAQGAHVYCQVATAAAAPATYARRDVTLLMPAGSGWLVRGLDADDRVVVRGVGLLWSMQAGAAPDDDD